MQKALAKSSRVALGITVLGALALAGMGCGSSPSPKIDARDAGKDSGSAGSDGGAGTTGTAGTDGGAGTTGTAGSDGGAGTAGTDGGAGHDGAAGTDGGAGADGSAGADGGAGHDGAAGTDGGAGSDGGAGADAAAGSDGGASDASDAGDAGDASDVPCQNACTLGTKQCGGGGIQTCVTGSSTCTVWGTAAACGTHSSCTGVSGSAACTCNVDPSCGSGTATFCASGTSQSTCGTDADGCFFVQTTTACPAHQSCTGNNPTGACTCNAAPVDCVGGSGATFCSTSGSVSTCKTDTNNCVFADAPVACAAHQACSGNPGVGACGCVTDAICTTVGSICANGASVDCEKDGNNCVFNNGSTTCGTHQSCNAGTGLCQCNATACTATGPFCDGSNVSTCARDANQCLFVSAANSTTCTANETCTGAAGAASCQCNAAPSACAGGAAGSFCTGTNDVTTCVADAHGCVTANPAVTCGPHQSCTGGAGAKACTCNAAPAGCTGAGTFCSSASTQSTCQVDGNNCPFSDAANDTHCPVDETCKGSGIGQTCTCDSTCTASQVGTYCTDVQHQASCTNDTNVPSCHMTGAPVACVGIKTCQGTAGGTGSCQCPAFGTTLGTQCTTAGDTICAGNTVLTCVTDGASLCNSWAMPVDCTSSSLVCGTKTNGGTKAACQCAEHSGNDYFADPVAGSDASAVFPTGIDTPSQCRFGTLGKALSLATTAGNRVVATSAAPESFATETFPLAVSPGVTLTTDAPLLPATYTIVFNSGAATGISLASSSTVEGFTVTNSSGNAAASAIAIVGTGATIDTVVLEGTSGTTLANGISVAGGGQGLINDATVTGFTTGVSVSTTSTSAVTLMNSHVSPIATGISLTSGTLSASTVTVNGGSGTGVVVKATGAVTSTLNGTALTVSGMTGPGIAQSASGGGSVTLNLASGDIGTNGGGGITLSAGSGTLGTVNVHNNTGAGITQSGGTLTLGSGGTTMVQTSTTKGIALTGGTLTVGAASITGNGTDGVTVSGAATALISNTGAQYTSNGGNGINSTLAALTFNGSAAAPILVSGNGAGGIVGGGDGILMSGGNITANYLTLSTNGTGTTKRSGLELTGAAAVSLGTASDAALSFKSNGLDGVNVNGTSTGSFLDMRRAQITANGGDGIAINLNGGTTAPGATASITSSTISGNTGNGISVTNAPLAGGVVKLTLDTLTVSSNGGIGVWLEGSAGSVAASLKNSKVSLNTGIGLKVEEAVGNITQETIQNNDITQNTGGGVAFSTASTLTSFQGNTIHGNNGDQIVVSARQNTAATAWPFRSIGNACDANRNQIYCYSSGGVGVRVNAAGLTTVDAENVNWSNSAPSAGTDYAATGTNSVNVATPCEPPVTTCP